MEYINIILEFAICHIAIKCQPLFIASAILRQMCYHSAVLSNVKICNLFFCKLLNKFKVDEDDEWEEGANEIGIVGNEIDELGPTARDIEIRRRGTNLWE